VSLPSLSSLQDVGFLYNADLDGINSCTESNRWRFGMKHEELSCEVMSAGSKPMQILGRILVSPRLVTIATAVLLSGTGAAWAGGGGATSESVQLFLNGICAQFGVTSCPQLPTVNQAVVESAALSGETPAVIRGPQNLNLPPASAVDAGTLAGLSNPLAFVSATSTQGVPIPTLPTNPMANSFLSATSSPAPPANPTTLNLTFDYLPRTMQTFALNQDVGDITLPLVVADSSQNPVRDVSATLQIRGTGGTSVTTDIMGDFLGTGTPQTDSLAALGITFSQNFTKGYEEVDVGIPLLVTSDVAPAYTVSAPGFEFDVMDGLFDGINPIASFLAASFADNAGDVLSAVNADLANAFDGSTIISAPVPTATPEPASLAVLGGGLVGLAVIHRRRRRKTT
jgi:hypothetical protein